MTTQISPTEIRLSNFSVRHRRANVRLTPDVTFSLVPGELVAVLGRNGTGKTLVTRALARALWPKSDFSTAGTLECGSQVVVGYAPQETGLLPWRRIRDNLKLPLVIRNHPITDSLATSAERFALDDKLDRFPNEVSGGFRVRISVCRAFIGSPTVVLLDEPTRNLDRAGVEIVLKSIDEFVHTPCSGAGWLVTHSVTEALRVADRCLVFTRELVREFSKADRVDWNEHAIMGAIQ